MSECELLPCPFCGGKPHLFKSRGPMWLVQCLECGAEASSATDVQSVAVEDWNRRTPAPGQGEAVEMVGYRYRDPEDAPDSWCFMFRKQRPNVAADWIVEELYSGPPDLAAENERLKTENEFLRNMNSDNVRNMGDTIETLDKQVGELRARVSDLTAEVEGLRKDAGRYRWLREGCGHAQGRQFNAAIRVVGILDQVHKDERVYAVEGDNLDKAIDASFAAQEKQNS
jgi:Lar family restriction alleviation protein